VQLVRRNPRFGLCLGREARDMGGVRIRDDDLDLERSIDQRYDAVDRLSVRMQLNHVGNMGAPGADRQGEGGPADDRRSGNSSAR
jgi:hypothetical protein